MKFQDYRTLFMVVTLILILLAASPSLSLIISFPKSPESFSELWLLDSEHTADSFPFNITVGEEVSLFLGVGNSIGQLGYYLVQVKFCNKTQPFPNGSRSEPSSLPSIFEFRFLLKDSGIWETPVNFKILDAAKKNQTIVIESVGINDTMIIESVINEAMVIERVSINDRVLDVDSISIWDSENSEFRFQLFFELWVYKPEVSSFQFNDRFVRLWLNMTG